ncbi:MAG: UdgX family uracil-DNA binding protein [Elusimicrobia bacterium]|nr:UdgX family uracil-DNA binding protein [Elusimicrobiota bacterium]
MARTLQRSRPARAPGNTSAREFIPSNADLPELRTAARRCRGCPLWKNASQTVFGEGNAPAEVMLVGEQPGDKEDLSGRPFVGPAGALLDHALEEAGIDRSRTFVTNAVKHFKNEPRGKRRIHKSPNRSEVTACLPWLEEEIRVVQPKILVCLGATAAKAVLGPDFRVTQMRGRVLSSRLARVVIATVHPSSILRAPDEESRRVERAAFVADLKKVAPQLT